ncbi:Dabb family protein [Sphaerotilus sp.]|uniref:Dabb family protein n=1 Tax=Sphaerotilus sp. TaxID=2093942 RepID=UPI0034E2BBFC
MLIHSALFWLRDDLSPGQRTLFEAELRRLAAISYLERGYAGPAAATERRPVTDNTFDYATCFVFKSMEDHAFYQTRCADHARFVQVCSAFWTRVVVHDIAPLQAVQAA